MNMGQQIDQFQPTLIHQGGNTLVINLKGHCNIRQRSNMIYIVMLNSQRD